MIYYNQDILKIFNKLIFWIGLGVAGFILLLLQAEPGKPKSPFFFIELILYIVFFPGLWLKSKKKFLPKIYFFQQHPFFSYVILSWFIGMLFELTLSDFGQIGGMHPKTIPSFIIAQGFYIPFAILFALLIRKYGFNLKEVYFASIAASLAEGILFNKILVFVILSPLFIFTPFLLGYYGLAYSLFTCMPLIFIPEEKLWSKNKRQVGLVRKIVYGFLTTLLAYIILFSWGSLMNLIFDNFRNF